MSFPSPEIPTVGSILDGYQLLEEIGRGACGRVFQAKNLLSGEIFALKIFPKQGSLSESELHAIRLYQKIEHPNLIRIHHVGQNGNILFYTMDWCECSLVQCKIQPEELLIIAKKLTDALAALHRHGLIHRDIKPANLYFKNGEIVLGDIGLVTRKENATFAGSPGFLAPSLLTGKAAPDVYTDCYALAKSFYCILSGLRPEKFPYYLGTLSPAASVLMRTVMMVCMDKPKIHNTKEMLHFLNSSNDEKKPAGKSKSVSFIRSAVFAMIFLITAALIFFLIRPNSIPNRQEPHRKIPEKTRSASAVRQTEQQQKSVQVHSNKIRKQAGEKKIRQNEKTPQKKIFLDILFSRNKTNIKQYEKMPKFLGETHKKNLKFQIDFINLRIRRLEPLQNHTEIMQEWIRFGRFEKQIMNLLEEQNAEKKVIQFDRNMKRILEIPVASDNHQWKLALTHWNTYKYDCAEKMIQSLSDFRNSPEELFSKMAQNDSYLQFFGIDQTAFLKKYQDVRYSSIPNEKQQCDAITQQYLQQRKNFLKSLNR